MLCGCISTLPATTSAAPPCSMLTDPRAGMAGAPQGGRDVGATHERGGALEQRDIVTSNGRRRALHDADLAAGNVTRGGLVDDQTVGGRRLRFHRLLRGRLLRPRIGRPPGPRG